MGTGDTTSEAAVSRSYVRRHGIPDDAILLENEGRTTQESMQAVARMLRKRGMKTAILVSDPFHMLASMDPEQALRVHSLYVTDPDEPDLPEP